MICGEELKPMINSNDKTIEAITTSISELKQEWQKHRRGVSKLVASLTCYQTDF